MTIKIESKFKNDKCILISIESKARITKAAVHIQSAKCDFVSKKNSHLILHAKEKHGIEL